MTDLVPPSLGTVRITASLLSGASCIVALPAGAQVSDLRGQIERDLGIPCSFQRLAGGDSGGVLAITDSLHQAGLANGSHVTAVWDVLGDNAATVNFLQRAGWEPHHHAFMAKCIPRLLRGGGKAVRAAALKALSWMGRDGAVHAELAAEIMRDPDARFDDRAAAAHALSWMGPEGAAFASDIRDFATGPLPTAVLAVGYGQWNWNLYSRVRLEQKGVAVRLAEMCADEDLEVRRAAVDALAGIVDGHYFYIQQCVTFLPVLEEAFFDGAKCVRRAACRALVRYLADGHAWPWILRRFLRFGEHSASFGLRAVDRDAFQELVGGISKICPDGLQQDEWSDRSGAEDVVCWPRLATVELIDRMIKRTRAQDPNEQGPKGKGKGKCSGGDGGVTDLLIVLGGDGVHNPSWRVREASLQALIDFFPDGARCASLVAALLEQETDVRVQSMLARYVQKYGGLATFGARGGFATEVPQVDDDDFHNYHIYDSDDPEAETFRGKHPEKAEARPWRAAPLRRTVARCGRERGTRPRRVVALGGQDPSHSAAAPPSEAPPAAPLAGGGPQLRRRGEARRAAAARERIRHRSLREARDRKVADAGVYLLTCALGTGK